MLLFLSLFVCTRSGLETATGIDTQRQPETDSYRQTVSVISKATGCSSDRDMGQRVSTMDFARIFYRTSRRLSLMQLSLMYFKQFKPGIGVHCVL